MHKVFQIFYSDETQEKNDPRFLPLDNMENKRPDWSEYWPIRNYLLSNQLDPNTFYGFLSPKFKSKTGLDSETVYQYIENNLDADVITFSPFFDVSAFYIGVFEQATTHKELLPTLEAVFEATNIERGLQNMVMSSRETVYCNYFVAKPFFWAEWFRRAESIFRIAEDKKYSLSSQLNSHTNHYKTLYPKKVFVIERLISYMLTTQDWNVSHYDSMNFPYEETFKHFKSELCVLDALKIAYLKTSNPTYLEKFYGVRRGVIESINKKRLRSSSTVKTYRG